ncbi:hypothetical protein SNEBB_002205 [Seison nebaliae]|nr:hypothetical protein SNEBB_002205 [Seison nebaliae]
MRIEVTSSNVEEDTLEPITVAIIPPKSIIQPNVLKGTNEEIVKEMTGKSSSQRQLWSGEETDIFYDGLRLHGRNFSKLHQFYLEKMSKKSNESQTVKSRDQIRHYYHRCWRRIMKQLNLNQKLDPNVEYLYVVNYEEFRRRNIKLDKRRQLKLHELVEKGVTTVRINRRTIRLNRIDKQPNNDRTTSSSSSSTTTNRAPSSEEVSSIIGTSDKKNCDTVKLKRNRDTDKIIDILQLEEGGQLPKKNKIRHHSQIPFIDNSPKSANGTSKLIPPIKLDPLAIETKKNDSIKWKNNSKCDSIQLGIEPIRLGNDSMEIEKHSEKKHDNFNKFQQLTLRSSITLHITPFNEMTIFRLLQHQLPSEFMFVVEKEMTLHHLKNFFNRFEFIKSFRIFHYYSNELIENETEEFGRLLQIYNEGKKNCDSSEMNGKKPSYDLYLSNNQSKDFQVPNLKLYFSITLRRFSMNDDEEEEEQMEMEVEGEDELKLLNTQSQREYLKHIIGRCEDLVKNVEDGNGIKTNISNEIIDRKICCSHEISRCPPKTKLSSRIPFVEEDLTNYDGDDDEEDDDNNTNHDDDNINHDDDNIIHDEDNHLNDVDEKKDDVSEERDILKEQFQFDGDDDLNLNLNLFDSNPLLQPDTTKYTGSLPNNIFSIDYNEIDMNVGNLDNDDTFFTHPISGISSFGSLTNQFNNPIEFPIDNTKFPSFLDDTHNDKNNLFDDDKFNSFLPQSSNDQFNDMNDLQLFIQDRTPHLTSDLFSTLDSITTETHTTTPSPSNFDFF